ncbi:SMI1/KNR4 family protein [Streptomyces sp. NPDC004270]
MTKLVSLPSSGPGEDLDWFATSALFEDVAAFVLRHVADDQAKRDLAAAVASGYMFIGELPEPDRTNVLTALRDTFPAHVDSEIYPPRVTARMDTPEIFVARAKSLARLAARSLARTTTALRAAEQVIALVRAHEGVARHGDGCPAEAVTLAEAETGLAFPPSYRRLIEEFGTWEVPPTEFAGVYRTPARGDRLLGSPTHTSEDRERLGLPHHLMVVMHDDVLGVVVLDTSGPDQDGEYPVYAWNPGVPEGGRMERIADSFGEFALDECRRNLRRLDREPETS